MAKKSDSRGVRDEMHYGPDPGKTRHLVPLKDLKKFRVADGDPDVRGWNVFTSTGREIGEVEDMLVDVDTGSVVMLDVDLRGKDRHTLTPVRATWIDRATKRVVVDAGEVQDELEDLPSFRRGAAASDEDVNRFDERYARTYGRHADNDEYRMRYGADELRFSGRDKEIEEDRLRTANERRELEAEKDAAARRTRFVQRQAPADDTRYQVDDPGERSVHYPARDKEEVVVERRPYVEEVVVRRRPVDEDADADLTKPETRQDRDRLG
jgi:sporulation protein YlmC with PRC-barrel domain